MIAFKEKTAAEPIKYGRNIQNTEDVIISEQIAESLGILPDDIIGEREHTVFTHKIKLIAPNINTHNKKYNHRHEAKEFGT